MLCGANSFGEVVPALEHEHELDFVIEQMTLPVTHIAVEVREHSLGSRGGWGDSENPPGCRFPFGNFFPIDAPPLQHNPLVGAWEAPLEVPPHSPRWQDPHLRPPADKLTLGREDAQPCRSRGQESPVGNRTLPFGSENGNRRPCQLY